MLINIILSSIEKIINPVFEQIAAEQAKVNTVKIINKTILEEYSKNFNYDDIIKIQKDYLGNIELIKADTLKMNRIACEFVIQAQNELGKEKNMDIEIPAGYISKNALISDWGPLIHVKARPIGNIEAKYISQFEGQGINQTRHKIHLVVTTNVKIIFPSGSSEIQVKSEMPIAETIIVGKIPENALLLDVKEADFTLPGYKKLN